MLKHFMATSALVTLLAVPAVSQQAQEPSAAPGAPPLAVGTEAPPLAPLVPAELSQVTADQLLGSSVINPAEENLGTIADAMFTADGKIESVVISFGGFLGFGSKTVQVPIDQVTVKTRGDGAFVVETNLTPEALEAMPPFETNG